MATIKLTIYVSNIDNVLTLYDTMQVRRSATAPPAADLVFLTDTTAAPAELVGTEEGPFILNGKTMTLKINGTEMSVTFVSPDPIAIPDVIDELNTAFGGAGLPATASDDGTGKLKIETDDSGTQFTIEMISGTALSVLGFSIGDKDNGEAAHIPLVAGTTSYEFDDGSGQPSYYYSTRFFNTANGTYSAWSDWIQGQTVSAVDSVNLIIGKIKLSDLDGNALSGVKVVIANAWEVQKVNGYGIFGRSISIETDSTGQAETTLVKGSKVDVIISGTSIIRRIVVPSTGTEFDLLDDSLVVADEFEIQRPDIPYAVRRS